MEITSGDIQAVGPAIQGIGIPALGEVKLKEALHMEFNEKGIQVWIKGEDRPMKGYPHPLICHPLWVWKRGFLTILRILFSPWNILNHLERYADIVLNYQNDPAKLSIAARSIYFALLETLPKYPSFCWATATWIDYDDSYRYTLQHVLGQLNKNDPTKREIRRLVKIYLSRQSDEYTRQKAKQMAKLLWFIPSKYVRMFISNLRVDDVKLDEDDLYWAIKINDYDFS